MFSYLKNRSNKKIYLKAIDGHIDHIHCLISLRKNQTIAQVAQMIKGESPFGLNKQSILQGKFARQDDYFAVSVSNCAS